MSKVFTLKSNYAPAGDQPEAISALVRGVETRRRHQTLLGATGTGKTFTIANVIEQTQLPTLVIAHNKTLAAQLTAEFREFFPENAVHYFVSYYDYYQPEAYMPISDTYIEKEAQINDEIDRLRHATTETLLTRSDVIVVASVSAIYGIGNPEEYARVLLTLKSGDKRTRATLVRELVAMYFERVAGDLLPGTFRALANTLEIMPASEEIIYRLVFEGTQVQKIEVIDPITREFRAAPLEVTLFPAKHFVTPEDVKKLAIADIEAELKQQLAKLRRSGRELDAERLKRRTRHDLALIREIGYCNGIENYSRHFDRRKGGEPPHTLLSYFSKCGNGKDGFLTVIDESHVTVPQIAGMYAGDRARKDTLVEYGFRLPSARDNRPLTFDEFEERVGRSIYVSATPSKYELGKSGKPVEQIIRPTGLIDPEIDVRPVVSTPIFGLTKSKYGKPKKYEGQVQDFINEAEKTTEHGGRSLVTVLTKKMAEDLAEFLRERGVRAEYIHSGIRTFERIEIMTNFRKGEFDVLVGVNLLREGLDLPEVELVGILDADKEGFLRSDTSLIQTIGRAARNVHGRVILYADNITGSMERALEETDRRREKQVAHNKKHRITPKTIRKQIKDISDQFVKAHTKAVARLVEMDRGIAKTPVEIKKLVKNKRTQMLDAAKNLDFETAALLRDEIKVLEGK